MFNLCCRLCSSYERKVFLDGIQYGANLIMELIEKPAEKPKPHFRFEPARTPGRYLAEAEDLVLGYFINPLLSVLLGVLVLGERLRRLQWLAVAIAALGVVWLTWQAGRAPWIATGAVPFVPDVPGVALPGVFTMRTPDDAIGLRAYVESNHCRSAVVVGGGFIGLEIGENLMAKGLNVTVIDMADQLMPNIFDPEMADYARRQLQAKGMRIRTGTPLKGILGAEKAEGVDTGMGTIAADVVVLARELNMDQVAYIHEQIEQQHITGPGGNLVRIEMFCHGALCMAVSGKCYMSLHAANRSANRGECTQICRRSYTVTDDVKLCNSQAYTALQFDLRLPEGLEIVSIGKADRIANHNIHSGTLPDGTVRFIAYNMQNADIKGNDGAIITLVVKASQALAPNDAIEVSHTVLATASDESFFAPVTVARVGNTTGVADVSQSAAKVYSQAGRVVIESAEATTAQLIAINGISINLAVEAGHNEYEAPAQGVYIVRIAGKSHKLVVRN